MEIGKADYFLLPMQIIQLDLSLSIAKGQKRTIITESDRTHVIVVVVGLVKLFDVGGAARPDVDGVVQGHRDVVVEAPVDQVQVEVVPQHWGVQHLVRCLLDCSFFLARALDLAVELHIVLVAAVLLLIPEVKDLPIRLSEQAVLQ